MPIPASDLVQITPRVLSGTGQGFNFSGLFLTEHDALPTDSLMPFYSASEVADFFGAGSKEYSVAQRYFNGFDNSQTKPTVLYFYKHVTSDQAAFVRSGAFDVTQAQLLANIAGITDGSITATINGNTETINNLDFSGVTSLSAAAAILQSGLRSVQISDQAASCVYATAVAAGADGNNLSIDISQGAPKVQTPAKAAENALATAKAAGTAGNNLSIEVTAGTPIKHPAYKASSAIGTAVTGGEAGNDITVTVTNGDPRVTAEAVAAASEIGTAKTAGAAGNNLTVEVTADSQEVTAAKAASCKYCTAKTAGADGNNLKVIITANASTPANFDVKINNGTSDVFTQENVTAGSTTDALSETDAVTWTPGVALAVETVQLSGGADAVLKDVYTVVTKESGAAKDTQEDLETPAALTDNDLVTFNKSLAAFTETNYTFSGGKDAETVPTFDVATSNGSDSYTQEGVLNGSELEDNALVAFDKSATLAVQTYTFAGGADAYETPTYTVKTVRNGGAVEVVDLQPNVESAADLEDNAAVTFKEDASLSIGTFALTGGAEAITVPTYDVKTMLNNAAVDQQTVESAQDLSDNAYVTFVRNETLRPGIYPLSGGKDAGGEAWSNAVVSYASNLNAFTVTTGLSGAGMSITDLSGPAAEAFYLTADQGATYSEGAGPRTYTETLNAILKHGQNWFSLSTIAHVNSAEAIEIAQWSNARYNEGNQFLYVLWDDDSAMLSTAAQESTTAAQLMELEVTGTACIYNSAEYAAFLMGAIASVQWDANNSTVTFAFKSQSGLGANVQNESEAAALEKLRVNFVGNYASRNDNFILLQHGEMFGAWHWIDSYVNSTWLTSELQVQILAGLQAARRVPYTVAGYTLIRSWCQSVIERAITNGVISAGVNLSQAQKTEIQQEAGLDISSDLYNNGFYLQILDADATVRQQRESPTMALWYTDAGSVHRISMPVTTVQ